MTLRIDLRSLLCHIIIVIIAVVVIIIGSSSSSSTVTVPFGKALRALAAEGY